MSGDHNMYSSKNQLGVNQECDSMEENKPVAVRYDFDGYGYQYRDSGSGSDWKERFDGEFLYTHPQKKLSNEEIDEIESMCSVNEQGRINGREFARAILRKTQEADKIESLGTVNIGGVHYRNGKEEK